MSEAITLLLTSSNLVAKTTNRFRLQLPSGGIKMSINDTVALQSCNVIYSWPNITASNNNNTFSIIIGTTTYPITMPDGFYAIADMNSFMQAQLYSLGLYLMQSNGSIWYPVTLVTNSTYYSVEFDLQTIPATLPSGWTNPAGVLFHSVVPASPAVTPQIVIPNTSIPQIFGISAGTYPATPATAAVSVLSSFTPQVTPVQSIVITSNLINNRVATPNNVLYSFSPSNVSYGSNIYSQPFVTNISVCPTTYQYIQLEFWDQSMNPLQIKDSNICVSLILTLNHPA